MTLGLGFSGEIIEVYRCAGRPGQWLNTHCGNDLEKQFCASYLVRIIKNVIPVFRTDVKWVSSQGYSRRHCHFVPLNGF